MWTRSELKARAREILNRNYWKAVLVSLIYMFLTGGGGGGGGSSVSTGSGSSDSASSFADSIPNLTSTDIAGIIFIISIIFAIFLVIFVLAFAFSLFVFCPLQIGCHRFFIRCENGTAALDDVVFAYSSCYLNVVKTMFFYSLYLTLWTFLFIIPGIIKGLEYRMIPYLIAENPNLSTKEAFALSKQMMDGEKWNAWVLDWSFFGWNLLSVFTCCILAVFYVAPYQNLTNAQLYAVLKNKVPGYFGQNTYHSNPYAGNNGYSNPYSNGNSYNNPYQQ